MMVLFSPKSARLNLGGNPDVARAEAQSAASSPKPIRVPNARKPKSPAPSPMAVHPRTSNGISTGKESLAIAPGDEWAAKLTVFTSSRQSPPAWLKKMMCNPRATKLSARAATTSGWHNVVGKPPWPGDGSLAVALKALPTRSSSIAVPPMNNWVPHAPHFAETRSATKGKS
jgi:hypothetical protein